MNKSNRNSPPKWALKLLRWFIKDVFLEEIEGDLLESFHSNKKELSPKKAKRIYGMEVLKLFRPILIKNLGRGEALNTLGMYGSYFKTSIRGIKRNLVFSLINVVGLGLSMSVGIFMILLLSELNSFDNFHSQKDKIYKVTTKRVQGTAGNEVQLSTASYFIGNQLKETAVGIEEVLYVKADEFRADLLTDEKAINTTGFYASSTFFDVFSFKMVQGNPSTALTNPNSLVLTQSTAKKLFGNTNPIGKSINIEQNEDFKDGVVTGVVEDPPLNSHLRFEVLVSLSTVEDPFAVGEHAMDNPGNTGSVVIYLIKNQRTSPEVLVSSMAQIMKDYNQTIEHPITHALQPMSTFVTSDTYQNRLGPMFSKRKLKILLGLTLVVLLAACFNYTNLSLARALKRSKEVGIRKVMGAGKFQVFMQFIVEAVLLAFLSLFLGILLFFILKPEFMALPNPAAVGYTMFALNLKAIHFLYFLGFALLVGILAGFQPALILSKFKARDTFMDASKLKLASKDLNIRHVLTGFQFAISSGLIICSVLVFKQYQYSLNYDLGYDTENIVNVPVNGDYIDLLENEYRKFSEVIETSKSSWVLGVGGDGMSVGMIMSKENPKPTPYLVNQVDESYLEMHKLTFLAGSGFPKSLEEGQEQNYAIINSEALNTLGMESPETAIGKTVLYNGNSLQIQGVVEDFISIALTKDIFKSFAFVQPNESSQFKSLNVKISPNNAGNTIKKLKEVYEELDPVHDFQASFYDDQIALVYEREKATFTIISFLAFLAICISTLGLFGMALYTMESRKKEIGIRKILGAGIQNLFLLLSREFFITMTIASLLSIPLTLYIVDNMVLGDFIYRIKIGFQDSLSGFIIMIIIGALTIGWQIRSVFVQNPTKALGNQ